MKNKILKIFPLDLIYFLLFTFVLILSRSWIQQFLLKLRSYAPQLNAINPNSNTIEAQNLITNINSLANNAYLFIFIIIPLIIFIIYILLQGYSFYLLKKEKNYLLKFALVSLPSIIFITLLTFNPNIYLFIITFLTMYLSFFLYFKDLNKIKLAFIKIYKYFPAFLLYLALSLIIITLLFVSYVTFLTQMNYLLLLIFALIFIIVFSYYKIYLIKLFN
jgi:hypothetical protein